MVSKKKSNLFVFFYDDDDVFSRKVLKRLEEVDDELEAVGIDLVKISDEGVEEDYDECDRGLPCLAHFKYAREPQVFYGSFADHSEMAAWIDSEAKRK